MIKSLILLALVSFAMTESPPVLIVDPVPGPHDKENPLDLRPAAVDLTDGIDHLIERKQRKRVNISTKKATEVFTKMERNMAKGQIVAFKYVLYEQQGVENGELLVTWRIGQNRNGARNYTVTLTTTNVNDPENPIHKQRVAFRCKYSEYIEKVICGPKQCELEPYEPVETPSIKCARNYRYAEHLISTVWESSHDLDKNDLGDGIYDTTLDCFRQKVETMPVHSNEICYYEGFEPENITPLSELEDKLFEDGWKRLENGTYERITNRIKKTAEVRVNENEMTMDDLDQ